MSEQLRNINDYADSVAAMSRALSCGDERGFRSALSSFDTVRDAEVLTGIRKVAVDLQSALERFEVDSRLIGLAQHQVPDARRQLEHVLKLTSAAAHQTMDLVEECRPLADQIADEARRLLGERGASAAPAAPAGAAAPVVPAAPISQLPLDAGVTGFLRQTADSMQAVRGKLSEVRLAQSYQDLTGQIVRSVMDLVDELERALGELARIAVFADGVAPQLAADTPGTAGGPVVPGVNHGDAVAGQQDVDALLSQLGM